MHFRLIFAFMRHLKQIILILFVLFCTVISARKVESFNNDWKFSLEIMHKL